MQKVTYLLGAGASAEALPTYENFRARFSDFVDCINNSAPPHNHQENSEESKGWLNLKRSAEKLLNELSFHSTPDTVAKKYFLSQADNTSLYQLKSTLVVFFFFEQTSSLFTVNEKKKTNVLKPKVDLRYDSFVSRLLLPIKGKFQFEPGFNILTWNYDLQFELCCKRFLNGRNPKIQDNLFSSIPSYSNDSSVEKLDSAALKIIHLNGVAMSTKKSKDNCDTEAKDLDSPEKHLLDFQFAESYDVGKLLNLYLLLTEYRQDLAVPLENHLTFGWENLTADLELDLGFSPFKEAKKICEETDVLVVIGYSFPSFNNKIDSELFKSFKKLHSIKIQSHNYSDIQKHITNELIPLIPKENTFKVEVSDVGYTNQFFIPRRMNTPINTEGYFGLQKTK